MHNETIIVFSSSIDYEIYLFDRAGHGFSSHLPRGFNYLMQHNLQDLRTVIQSQFFSFLSPNHSQFRFSLKGLGWNKETFSIIGHSYGATLGILVESF